MQSCKQNSVPESGHASLFSLKVIEMSQLAIDGLLILWSFHELPHCCEQISQFVVMRLARY